MQAFGPQCPWYEHFERFGPPTIKYCEERICALVNEPYNSWSNLAYILAGLLILTHCKTKAMRMLSLSVIFMGLASFFYHATNNLMSQFGDYIGMFTYVCLLLTFNLKRGKRLFINFKVTYLSLAFILSIFFFLFYYLVIPVQLVIGLFALIILFSEFLLRTSSTRYVFYSYTIGFFALGELASLLDATRVYCTNSQPLFNGHSLWHIFGGIGTYFSYKFYEQFTEL